MRTRTHLGFLLLIALVIRVAMLADVGRTIVFSSPLVDAYTYDQTARAIVENGLSALETPFYQPPAYPLALSAVYLLSGGSYWAPRILQLLLGAWTVALVFGLARRLGGLRSGWIAGLMMATYGIALFFEGELLPPALILTLLAGGLTLLLQAEGATPGSRERRWRLLAAGAFLGAAGAVRPTLLLLAGLALIWWLRGSSGGRRARGREGILLLVALALPVLPFAAANRIGSGENVLVSTNGGINFYLGNGANSDSLTAIQPGYAWDRLQLEPLRAGHGTATAESAYWFARGLREATGDPGAWAATAGRKVLRLLDVRETARNTDYEDFRRDSRVLSLPWTGFGLVAPLAALGLFIGFGTGAGGRRARWLLGAVLVTVAFENVAFFVAGRYRLEAVPVLCVLAGLGLDVAIRRRGRVGVGAAVALVLTTAVVWVDFLGERPIDETRAAIHRAVARQRAGLHAGSARALHEALRISPDDVDAHYLLGTNSLRAGDLQGAVRSFERALAGANDHLRALLGAAACLDRLGRGPEAENHYRRAVSADPFSVDARLGLGVHLAVHKQWAAAEAEFRQGLRMDPADPRFEKNLRQLERQRTESNVIESPTDSAQSPER